MSFSAKSVGRIKGKNEMINWQMKLILKKHFMDLIAIVFNRTLIKIYGLKIRNIFGNILKTLHIFDFRLVEATIHCTF